MLIIEGIRIKNFRVLKDVTLGRTNKQSKLPDPPQFICIEEPENGLYHKLLEILAAEFRHAMQTKKIAQIFITTHQPYFVDGLSPEETWLLEKGSDGFSNIQRASDNKIVKAMVDEGLPLGGLWYSDYMDAR